MAVYTKDQLDEVLGKLALASNAGLGRATLLLPHEADIVMTEVAALRKACDCYDGSKGIELAEAVAKREAREKTT